jgi:uncharacterized protein HemX
MDQINQQNNNEENRSDLGETPSEVAARATGGKENKIGPVAGIIIVVIILIIGALYFWGKKLNEKQPAAIDPLVEKLNTQNQSDEINAIETDLNNTNLNDLGESLDNLEL